MRLLGKAAFLVAVCNLPVFGQGIITTAVGTQWIFPANPGPGPSIPLGAVSGVATDASGNLYIADPDNHVVLKGKPGGTFAVVAGNGIPAHGGDGGPATAASLLEPGDVALDGAGNLYIYTQGRVRKVNTSGIISTLVTGLGNVSDNGMAVDAAGNVYVGEYGGNTVKKITPAGVASVVAGSGTRGFSGDNGQATRAQLGAPIGVAVDTAGNLFIADNLNGRIRKVTPGGVITTFAGGGTDPQAKILWPRRLSCPQPSRLAFDSSGNLFVSEYFQRVRKITPAGRISTAAGNVFGFAGDGGPAVGASIRWPRGINLEGSGSLYIADSGNQRVRQVVNGIINSIVGNDAFRASPNGTLATSAWLYRPVAVAVDPTGNLFVTDSVPERIRKVTPAGIFSTVAGGPAGGGFNGNASTFRFNFPDAIAFDAQGNYYVGDIAYVTRISPGGTLKVLAGTGSCINGKAPPAAAALATTVALCGVNGVAVDGSGNVYFSEEDRVWKILANGTISVVAGSAQTGSSGDNGPAAAALLSSPSQLLLDSAGTLFIADSGNNRVRKISAGGMISAVAGTGTGGFAGDGGPALNARLAFPQGLALDGGGNLLIADTNNRRIRKVSAAGVISTIAGTGTKGSSGDGGPPLSASLMGPSTLALDAAGNLFIADPEGDRVRVILAATPTFTAAPATLSYSAVSGGTSSSSQIIHLGSSLAGLAFTAQASGAGISVTPAGGTMPADLHVVVDPARLPAGTSTGSITVTATGANPGTRSIAVTATIAPPPAAAKLGVSVQNVSYSLRQSASAASSSMNVENDGGGTLDFTATVATDTGSWLSVSPTKGTATPATPVGVTITATPGTLAPGTYTGSVKVAGTTGGTSTVPVTMTVTAVQRKLVISQTGMTFTAVAQGGSALPQSFGILNTGQGTMDWTAGASTLSGGNWLRVDKTSGTVTTPFTDVSFVNVSVDATGVAPGDYYGSVKVTAPGAPNSPQNISVLLNVMPAGSNPGAEVRPTGLIFIGTASDSPGSQDVMVSNPTSASVTFGSSRTTVPSNGNWFVNVPTDATVQPNAPQRIVVQPDYSKLTAGTTSRGFLNLGFLDGTSRNISVLTVVAPEGTNPAAIKAGDREASGCTPASISILPTTLTDASASVQLAQPTTLSVRMVDNCGTAVTSSGGGVASISSNGDSQVTLVHIGDGNWSGTWQPKGGSAGQRVTVQFVGYLAQGGNRLAGTASLSVTLRSVTSAPLTFGAANAASFVGTFISPGGLVSIFGQQLADTEFQASSLPFPAEANGTQVLMGGVPLPLRYVGGGQINAQVPFELGINTEQQLIVRRGATISVPQDIVVAPAQPAVYTVNQSGSGPGVIVNGATNALITTSSPAGAGTVLVIYCNGLGAVTPPIPSGTAAPPNGPLSRTANELKVKVGGLDARVDFAGLAPGYPDLYQVNAVVPAGVAAGDAVEVVLTIAGQSSPPVTIAVR